MTSKRMIFLQELLALFGLKDRLRLEWISSSEAQKFVQVVTEFTEQIRSMGPSPLHGKHKIDRFAITGGMLNAKDNQKLD